MPLPPAFSQSLDLDAYLDRIGHRGPRETSLELLEDLSLRHVGRIPFENLDPLCGVPVRLDLPSLEAKLVKGGRGGYCFEHNLLFAAVLDRLGFPVALREARVRYRVPPGVVLGRTHGALQVEAGGRSWLVDVGFGAEGLLGPVPLDGTELRRHGEAWRLVGGSLLQAHFGDGWRDFYALQPGEVEGVDWEVANHYCSTHPDSRFVRVLTVQTSAPGRRRILRGGTFMELGQGEPVVRELGPGEVFPLLRDFGLRVEEGILERLAAVAKNYNDVG